MKRIRIFVLGIGIFILMPMCDEAKLTNSEVDVIQSYRRGLTMITPSEQWREALPSGNGTIAALVYGSINQERVLFNHNELWYMGNITDVPDMSAELPVVRKLLLDGKYDEANEHYRNKMREKGFNARNAVYHPAFDMILNTEVSELFEDYSRTVDFETGEVKVKWMDGETRFSRRLFVSIPDNISVMSIKTDKNKAVSGSVTLDIHDLKDAIQQNGLPFDPGFTYETSAGDGYIEFRADGSDGGEFGGVIRVITKNGEMSSSSREERGRRGGRRNQEGTIMFESADEVVLLVSIFANEKSDVAVSRLKGELAAIDGDYNDLFNRHKVLHIEKFNSMGISLNITGKRDTPNEILLLDAYQNPASIELVEKLFDYGRYLLISSSTSGGYPANLQGIWNGDYRPPWSSLFGINENLEMNYWQALPGNLKESMMAFYDYFDSHMDQFRYNAKQLWGCEGIYIPPFMSPESGIMRMTAPHVVNWTDAAGWLASFYYDYYLFTGDIDFLENRAVPFMKEVALFYESYIIKDDQGKNMFFPANSPENRPSTNADARSSTGGQSVGTVQINPTMAVAISKEVLNNLVESCELLGIEQASVERWKALLKDMPDYEINEDGAMREWLYPGFEDNYNHRHQSHIYPLFPGHEITEESSPELYEACRVAIEKRLVIGLKSQTGWSLAHMANVYARLGEGERALEALNILSRCCLGQNLFTYHNDWRKMGATMDFTWGRTSAFQMDANFGVSAAVIEMLCGSTADMIRVLPALPPAWVKGEFNGMLTRTGVVTSADWDMDKKKLDISLLAQRNTVFDLKLPGEPSSVDCSLPDVISSSEYGERYRKLNLKNGQHISVHVKF